MPAHAEEIAAKLEAIVLRLPGTTFERHGPHAKMCVGKTSMGWFMNNHHGDGVMGFTCKVLPGEDESLLRDTKKYYLPAYTRKGWVGRRLDTPRVNWTEVKELVEVSYRLLAPKRLVKELDAKNS